MRSELESDVGHVHVPFRESHPKVHNAYLLLIGDVILIKVKIGQGVVCFLHGTVTIFPFETNNL